MSDDTHRALIRQRRAGKYLRGAVVVFFLYMMAIGTFSAIYTYKVQSTVARNQKINSQASEDRFARYTAENERQHALTQQYVKCLFTSLGVALQKPIDTRTYNDFSQEAFDKCGAQQVNSTVTYTPSITPSQTSNAPQNNGQSAQPTITTSAPPDPTERQAPSFVQSLINPITKPLKELLN